jgi:hypothetical protein
LNIDDDLRFAEFFRQLTHLMVQLLDFFQDINATLQAPGGFVRLVTFTADFIGGLTPLQFVDILKDYRLLSFLQDPGVLADQQQAQQAATPQ